jgi:hypothetical protein
MWTLAFGHQKAARSKKHLRRPCVDRAEPLGRFVLEGSRDPARATSLGVRHARAGPADSFRRGNAGDLKEVYPASVGTFVLRGRYFSPHLFVQREVNDETRSDRYRKRGHFGSDCLGGGECTIWLSSSRLWSCSSLWALSGPVSKVRPPSRSSICPSALRRSARLHPGLWSAAL